MLSLRLLAVVAVIGGSTVRADSAPEVVIPRVERLPTLDAILAGDTGRLLRLDAFRQREPSDGQPASQTTVAYLAYDREAILIAFLCDDDRPDRIRGRLSPRDRVEGDDWVHAVLDTFADGQRAYVVAANPRGVQWDAVWTEGQGMDPSFDLLYHTNARPTANGWAVTLRVPFASLRYPQGEQRWRLSLGRGIVHRDEEVFWPQYSTTVAGRLTQAGWLLGLEGLSRAADVQWLPSSVARLQDHGTDVATVADAGASLDVKVVPRRHLVVDLAVNPDFSQIESDEPQIVVNERFEPFYPERRPFFLENADMFQAPLSLVFTRRVGDPRVGVKVTGRGTRWQGGVLLADDEATTRSGGDAAGRPAWFGIGRLARSVGTGQAGVMATARKHGDASNLVGSADGRWSLGPQWVLSAQAAGSRSRRTGGVDAGYAARAVALRTGRHVRWDIDALDVSPSFEAQAGFVPRRDIRMLRQRFDYLFRPTGRFVLSVGPSLFVRPAWNHAGTQLHNERAAGLVANLRGATRLEVWLNADEERVGPADVPGLSSSLRLARLHRFASFRTGVMGWSTWRLDVYDGTRANLVPAIGAGPHVASWRQVAGTVTLQPTTRLRADTTYTLARLKTLDTGARIFANHVGRTQWNLQVTRGLSARTIVQITRVLADPALTRTSSRTTTTFDLLVAYRANPWTAVYVGANDFEDTLGAVTTATKGRQVFIKVAYLVGRG